MLLGTVTAQVQANNRTLMAVALGAGTLQLKGTASLSRNLETYLLL